MIYYVKCGEKKAISRVHEILKLNYDSPKAFFVCLNAQNSRKNNKSSISSKCLNGPGKQ